jgi:hypothetical protein
MKISIKRSVYFLSRIALITCLVSCGGKGGDPTPAPEQTVQDEVKAKLTANTWAVQSVTVDGVDRTAVYKDLTIKFSAANYTATHGGSVWPASGAWSFTDQTATTIKRDDDTQVSVVVTDNSLTLGLTWSTTTLGPGRMQSVNGQHVFVFKKQ